MGILKAFETVELEISGIYNIWMVDTSCRGVETKKRWRFYMGSYITDRHYNRRTVRTDVTWRLPFNAMRGIKPKFTGMENSLESLFRHCCFGLRTKLGHSRLSGSSILTIRSVPSMPRSSHPYGVGLNPCIQPRRWFLIRRCYAVTPESHIASEDEHPYDALQSINPIRFNASMPQSVTHLGQHHCRSRVNELPDLQL
jgi:hypothetical protein